MAGGLNPPSMNKIIAYAKMPSTWVILVVGAVIGLAFGSRLGALKTIAKKIPGADA